ncbi:YbjN domain-containing protein [Canibacter zhoujuaniae]|uniref:YbjN domain-containing protein n=1 Tax=Canibacter zhoujuaniae TaxID=2708343 RepID=UPI0014245744|nr:YbjN domain-containing protein [Canibacter zhoujuaniae]
MRESSPANPDAPEPLQQQVTVVTLGRLIKLFDSYEWHYELDEEGYIKGLWNNYLHYFHLDEGTSNILQITAFARESVDPARRDELEAFIDDWHRERHWPKLIYEDTEDGDLLLRALFAHDFHAGATDAQLDLLVNCALTTIAYALDAAAEQFSTPDTVLPERDY